MTILVRLALVLVMALALAACGDRPVSSADPAPTPRPSGDRGRVVGVVRDAAGKPIVGARIGLVSGPGPMIEMTVLTNERGEYSWPNLAPGPWTLSAHADGYKGQEKAVTVPTGATATLDFAMEKE